MVSEFRFSFVWFASSGSRLHGVLEKNSFISGHEVPVLWYFRSLHTHRKGLKWYYKKFSAPPMRKICPKHVWYGLYRKTRPSQHQVWSIKWENIQNFCNKEIFGPISPALYFSAIHWIGTNKDFKSIVEFLDTRPYVNCAYKNKMINFTA